MLPTVDPSNDPTADPTADPTRRPTIEPTDEPTTSDPTSLPTSNPSAQPTEQPTSDPSVDPTRQPTRQPSADPTDGPTADPTQSPSLDPTQTPSSSPSSSPTCNYVFGADDESQSLTAGANTANIADEINVLKARMNDQIVDDPTRIIIEGSIGRLNGYFLDCDEKADVEICFVQCMGSEWCQDVSIEIEDVQHEAQLKEVAILCQGQDACADLSVDIASGTVESFTLLCYGKFACLAANMSITVPTDHFVNVTILCGGDDGDGHVWSCQGMEVSLHIQSGQATIGCYDSAACDSLSVSVDSEAVRLNVEMFEFSENVQLSHPNQTMIDIDCSADDAHRFIEIDPSADSLTVPELRQMARNQFVSGQLPCDGIEIVCPADTSLEFAERCDFEYEVTHFYDELELLDSVVCYWLDVTAIFKPQPTCHACSADHSSTLSALLSDMNDLIIIAVAAGAFVCFITVLWICRANRKRKKRIAIAKQSPSIRNAMVLLIGIAQYEKKPKAPDFDGYVPDLVGLEHDINGTLRVFRKRLKFECFPHYNKKAPKLRWTKAELEAFIEERAAVFEANLRSDSAEKYDALICVVSCHGMNRSLITSDYKLLKTVDFHRFFSKEGHTMSRMVPRIFIFDCCDGNVEYGKFVSLGKNKFGTNDEAMLADVIGETEDAAGVTTAEDQGKDADGSEDEKVADESETESDEEEKNEEEEKVAECSVSSEALWAYDTEHPDHQLAVLNASTWGFQSKLNTGIGSYLIAGFVDRAEKQLKALGCVPRIGALFKEIQEELRKLKKQLPIYIWNGNTENITIYPRSADTAAVEHAGEGLSTLEMVALPSQSPSHGEL